MPGGVLDACLQLRLFDDPPEVVRVSGCDLVVAPAAVIPEKRGLACLCTSSFQRAFLISSSKIAAVI
jgi:hypothetical protein